MLIRYEIKSIIIIIINMILIINKFDVYYIWYIIGYDNLTMISDMLIWFHMIIKQYTNNSVGSG